MFGAPVNSGITLTKVIGGISKTLSIANQVIPLYREAKPMINNAKTILSVLKDFNSGSNSKNNIIATNNTNNQNKKDTVSETKIIRYSNPSFFL